jgi:hypothetical protein
MIEIFQSARDSIIRWVEVAVMELDNPYNTMGYGSSEAEQLMKEVFHFFVLMPFFYLVLFPILFLWIIVMYLAAFVFCAFVKLPVNTVVNLSSVLRKR